uniref:Uncharacterized protein n=1 Tax=Dunaliella tertiolecta TaxID=3047 RepID=A0A7S3VST0_DUNTE
MHICHAHLPCNLTQAAAEAAIRHAKEQEAQARQAQEALQQQLQAQAQQQQHQHAVHMQEQYMRQLEELQRSAAQQTMALQQQVAAQSTQLAALAEQRQKAEAELRKRRVHDQGDKLRAALEHSLQQRIISKWRAVTLAQKEAEARAQEQLARCRIDKVARGMASPAFRRAPHTPVASPDTGQTAAGKRRRQDGTPYSPSTLSAAPPISSGPSTPAPVPSHLPLPSIILPELRAALFHASTSAAATAADSANGANLVAPLPGANGSSVRTAAWRGGLKAGPVPRISHAHGVSGAAPHHFSHQQLQQQEQVQLLARQTPMFWKLVVSTGVSDNISSSASSSGTAQGGILGSELARPSPPISSLQVAAASWLQAKLACGRSGAPFHPPFGKLLTLLNVPLDPDGALRNSPFAVPSHATLCVEDLDPRAVAADPPPFPRYSSSSMAATAGIMLLVSGPSPPSHFTTPSFSPSPTQATQHHPDIHRGHQQQHSSIQAGSPAPDSSANSLHHTANGVYASQPVHGEGGLPHSRQEVALSMGVQAELAGSWEDLKRLLAGLAPGVQVPLTVLALTDAAGVPAVLGHLEATAGRWPSELTARIARCIVLPLLPQHLAEAGLIQGLRHLAANPPGPLLAASCCSGAWGSGPYASQRDGPQALAEAGGGGVVGKMWGAPQRAGIETLVRDLLEACLLQQEQGQGVESSTQDAVHAFNDGLAALAHGVHSTATCPAASWGLPAPETSPSSQTAAPLCWHPSSVTAAVQDLLSAQVPPHSLPPSPMGPPSAASLLHAHFAQWASLRTGPSHCLLLPQFLASATPPPSLPHTVPSTTSQGRWSSSFLARSPGGFVRAASTLAPTARQPSAQASGNLHPPHYSQLQQQAEWPSTVSPTLAQQRQQKEYVPPFSHASPPPHAPSAPVVTLGSTYPSLSGGDVVQDTQQLSRRTLGSDVVKSRAQQILLQLGHLVPDPKSPM